MKRVYLILILVSLVRISLTLSGGMSLLSLGSQLSIIFRSDIFDFLLRNAGKEPFCNFLQLMKI